MYAEIMLMQIRLWDGRAEARPYRRLQHEETFGRLMGAVGRPAHNNGGGRAA